MWITKYKPRTLEEYNYHKHITDIINNNFKDLKNILFFGPPGSGKTTLTDIIISQIYKNPEIRKLNVIKLNASDERGINDIKNRVKTFCLKKPSGGFDFKIIILDEADTITIEAQSALRKIMEDYSNTKFYLICNYEDNIIKPISSRCLKLQFKKISNNFIKEYIHKILISENIVLTEQIDNLIDIIINDSNGDIRKILNTLETTIKLINSLNIKEIKSLIGIIPDEEIKDFILSINRENIYDKVNEFLRNSYPIKKLIKFLIDYILENRTDMKFLLKLSKYDNYIFNNTDKEIILISMFNDIIHHL